MNDKQWKQLQAAQLKVEKWVEEAKEELQNNATVEEAFEIGRELERKIISYLTKLEAKLK